MKLEFVSFQGVHSNGRSWGMVRVMEPIIDSIPFKCNYHVSHTKRNYKYFKRVSVLHHFISTFLWNVGSRLKLSVGLLRYLQELSFDYFLSRKLQYPCIIVSTAITPITARKNHLSGGVNIFIAGNPYDGQINNLLENEKKKYGIKISNAYTFRPRLNFINNYLSFQNEILTQSIVSFESFNGKFSHVNRTLIPYELLPDTKLFPDTMIPKAEVLTFLYLGSTVWIKGLTYLIDAWNMTSIRSARLVVAGPIFNDVWNYIKEKLPQSVDCVGFVSSNKLNDLYRSSHVCIVPSLIDDHPATIAEAMYCGLPVIATEGCGSKILISEGKNGFIIPEGNAEALSNKITWYIKNHTSIGKMGLAAREAINSIDKHAQAVEIAAFIKEKYLKIGH